MRKLFTLALVAVSLSPAAALARRRQQQSRPGEQPPAAAAPRWETYTYPGEEFSVSLPEMPAITHVSRAVRDRPNDRLDVRGYGAYADGVVYQIWSYDRPQAGEDVDYFAQYFKTHHLPRDEAYERRAVKLGGFDGKHYTFKTERFPDDEFSFYVYRARRHAYVVTAHGAGERDAAVRRFFQSFGLSDAPAGRAVVDDSPPAGEKPKGDERRDDPAKSAAPDDAGRSAAAEPPPAPDAPVDYTRTFKMAELTRRASVIFRPTPPYTEVARKEQITGTVTLRLVLNANGTVTNIAVISRLPHGLTERAVHAARGLKFIPAEKDGRRVSQYATIQYNFNIY